MGDRYPFNQAQFPEPPPRNNGGADGGGGPPRRDRRRSRSLGADLVCRAMPLSPSGPSGFQSSIGSTVGQLCTYDTGPDEGGLGEEATTLMAFLKAYDFAENAVTGLQPGAEDPFAGASSSVIPDTIKQSLEVIANLQWGHDGVTKKVVLNLPAGQIVKLGLAASYARAHAKLTAKYLQRFQGVNVPAGGTETFFYIDADPNTRNNIWNSIDSPALNPLVGFDRDTAPSTPIHIDGILSIGTASVGQGGSFDRSSRATRRFFGSFPVEAGAYAPGLAGTGALVFCPIAFGASAVMLQTNPTAFTTFVAGAAALSPLIFGMIDHAGNIIAQQPANTFLPLCANCQQIFVYNTAANGAENPFALIYDLGL